MNEQLYNLKDLIMRCNLSEPFCGAIDDGKGTIAYVNTDVLTKEDTVGTCVYYEKRIMLRIDKVTHIVKKGDSLWAIAQKLNVSVDEIAKSSGVKDVNLIKAGDVLDINVNIRYGYQVSGMVDTLYFSPQAQEYGYTPLSEREWYNTIDKANSIVDNIAGALADNSGKSRVGNNFKVYVEKPNGRPFYGNQYIKTYGLEKIGKGIGRVATPIAVCIEGCEIYDGWKQDERSFGHNTQKQIVGAVGGIAGGVAGAVIGAKVGFFIGALFGGVGAIPGAIIGGFLGGYFGSDYSETGIEYMYDEIRTIR